MAGLQRSRKCRVNGTMGKWGGEGAANLFNGAGMCPLSLNVNHTAVFCSPLLFCSPFLASVRKRPSLIVDMEANLT